MDKEFAQALISYIEHSNNVLEKYAAQSDRFASYEAGIREERELFQEKLAEALDVLTNDGVIPAEYKDAVFSSMKDRPEKVAEFLKNANNRPTRLGESSSSPNKYIGDPILEFALGDFLES